MNDKIPDLVKRFLSGDREAFAELVKRYQKKIYSIGFRLLGNHLDADEVVQETFVRIYRKRNELENINYFSTFLLRIATNYALDLLRKRKGHVRVDNMSSDLPGSEQLYLSRHVITPGEQFENKELMMEIWRALRRLPPRQRLTVILHDIEGFSTSEIAHALESPEATVRSNLHIARKKLRGFLKQRLEREE